MARPSNKDARRSQIARGMMAVMAVSGYDGATIADVAREAGLTSGLVHYHFSNKLDILLAVLKEIVSERRTGLQARLDVAGEDTESRLNAFIEYHLGLGEDADPQALACWIVITAEALRKPEVRAAYGEAIAEWSDLLAGIIKDGISRMIFPQVDPAGVASALLAAIEGYYVLAAAAPERIPPGSAAGSVLSMAEGLLNASLRSTEVSNG